VTETRDEKLEIGLTEGVTLAQDRLNGLRVPPINAVLRSRSIRRREVSSWGGRGFAVRRWMAVDRRWLRLGVPAAVLVAILLTLPIALTPGVRARLTAALGDRFDSEVEIEALRVSVLPRLRVQGEGVVLRHRGRSDVPPLVSIGSFAADATLFGLFARPLRLTRVYLDGLEINVPPGGLDIDDEDGEDGDEAKREEGKDTQRPAGSRSTDGEIDSSRPRQRDGSARSPVVVGDLLSERAVLRILRREADKPPRVFEIAHLSMQDTGSNVPWPFEATLTNPTPPGEISTQGTFGPWDAQHPSQTPLDAAYEFRDADLGAFDGIRGMLQSTGAFAGVLERIEVNGRADVPDFALDDVGQPLPLTTQFHAIVDGTNGNTWLEPVNARLGRTPIVASGGIVERDGEDGRTVTLDVVIDEGRIEDVLRLVVKGASPPMTGALNLKTKLVLPPGKGDPIEKLRLDGSFEVGSARFAKGSMQARMDELSEKARGDDSDGPPDRVVSNFTGRFVMRGGAIQFSKLTFAVPGAKIDLAGRYTIRSEALDFRGTVRLDAKLSELTTGVKSFLLKIIDPLVRRKNVTVIPVTIKGTAGDPDFGLDVGRAFTPK
jgi:hypothetical protein